MKQLYVIGSARANAIGLSRSYSDVSACPETAPDTLVYRRQTLSYASVAPETPGTISGQAARRQTTIARAVGL